MPPWFLVAGALALLAGHRALRYVAARRYEHRTGEAYSQAWRWLWRTERLLGAPAWVWVMGLYGLAFAMGLGIWVVQRAQ
jgi:hypothetical protein